MSVQSGGSVAASRSHAVTSVGCSEGVGGAASSEVAGSAAVLETSSSDPSSHSPSSLVRARRTACGVGEEHNAAVTGSTRGRARGRRYTGAVAKVEKQRSALSEDRLRDFLREML